MKMCTQFSNVYLDRWVVCKQNHFQTNSLNNAIKAHFIDTGHALNKTNLKPLKRIIKPKYLNTWELFVIGNQIKMFVLLMKTGSLSIQN